MYEEWLAGMKEKYPPEKAAMLQTAWEFAEHAHANQQRMSGDSYVVHPINVAKILFDLDMDADTVIAALLHDVLEDTEANYDQLSKTFGADIAQLVEGVTKLGQLKYTTREERQAESLRKMLLAMAKDLRVILIKLADRLHNMRTLNFLPPEKRTRIAQETLEIYAAIAHRLGINRIKNELEDLSFAYLEPEEYALLQKKADEERQERADYLKVAMETIKARMDELGIKGEIYGRPKELYSIYRKMKSQNKTFEEIYDLTAVRILVDTVKDCYGVLGIVHTIWKPIPGRFKDYIAVPKQNLYQSLHTTVIGEKGTPFEVQIRTYDMHKTAEYGIAAHWKYKQEGPNGIKNEMDSELTWLRQLLEWQSDTKDPHEFLDSLKIDLFSDTVFVFTPKGDVIDLATGATPLDFAYSIHSAVGHRCVGAKINGRIVTLDTKLKTGDIVEILTSSTAHGPSRDWLNIVATQQAKSKIRQWFKREMKEENIIKGRDMLEREMKRQGYSPSQLLKPEWLDSLYKKFSLTSVEDLYAFIGYGGQTTNQVINRLAGEYRKENKQRIKEEAQKKAQEQPGKYTSSFGILVKGEANMVVRFAKCCNPVPGDEIVGYITRGRGVSVHHAECRNLVEIAAQGGPLIEVEWAEKVQHAYSAHVQITASESPGLVMHVSQVLLNLNINMTAINARVDKNKDAVINIAIDIMDTQQLDKIIKQLKKLPMVKEVFRTHAQ
ncbi:MAG: RelA/SpoT family protein [Christensenellales bacterium]